MLSQVRSIRQPDSRKRQLTQNIMVEPTFSALLILCFFIRLDFEPIIAQSIPSHDNFRLKIAKFIFLVVYKCQTVVRREI